MADRKTFNVPDCHCGEDHDGIAHIVLATIVALKMGVFDGSSDPDASAARAAESAAEDVGWVKAADELEELRKKVSE